MLYLVVFMHLNVTALQETLWAFLLSSLAEPIVSCLRPPLLCWMLRQSRIIKCIMGGESKFEIFE